jgi:hypothetical protein
LPHPVQGRLEFAQLARDLAACGRHGRHSCLVLGCKGLQCCLAYKRMEIVPAETVGDLCPEGSSQTNFALMGQNDRAENSHLPFRKRARNAGLSIAGWIAALRLHSVCNPQLFLRPSQPPFCSHNPLPPARSLRGLDLCGKCHLSIDNYALSQANRVKGTTPSDEVAAKSIATAPEINLGGVECCQFFDMYSFPLIARLS